MSGTIKKELTRDSFNEIILTDRDSNIDLIRIIACFAVVGLHAMSKDISVINAILYYFCGFAVPFFFMTSGYFLLNRGNVSWNYSRHRMFGIIRAVFFWNAIMVAARLLKQLFVDHEITIRLSALLIECARSLVQKGTMWQFWYMGALLIIYALLPIISQLSKKGKGVLLGIAGIVAVVFEVLSIVQGRPIQADVTQTFRIWTWLFYFVLGSEMKIVKQFLKNRIDERLHILITACLTIVVLAYQNYAGINLIISNTRQRLNAEYFYDSILEMLWISLLFSLLLRVKISAKVHIFVAHVAPLTMGIYIIHPLLLKLTGKIVVRDSVGKSIICWLVTLLISVTITWIINRMPIRKYLLKI